MLTRRKLHRALNWVEPLGLGDHTPYYSTPLGVAYNCDSLRILSSLPGASVDLVMTSPPFALTRKKEYGNEPAERYLAWLLPFTREIHRVLKPTGSFVLDIGGAWVPGAPVRSMYHFKVALAMVEDGWRLAQDFYWHNPARLPSPAEWVTVRRVRVKDAVNMVWWFSKTDSPKADNRRVLQPYSESMKALLKNGYKAKLRPSGHDISDNFARDNGGAIPENLLVIEDAELDEAYLRNCEAKGIKPPPTRHPEGLVRFFLNLLTDEGDLVVDPFGGSNTTGAAAEFLRRRWLSCEIEENHLEGSTVRFDE